MKCEVVVETTIIIVQQKYLDEEITMSVLSSLQIVFGNYIWNMLRRELRVAASHGLFNELHT